MFIVYQSKQDLKKETYKDAIVDVSMQKASPGRNAQIGRDVDWSVTQITRIVAIGAENALARIERLVKGVMEFRKLKNGSRFVEASVTS